MYGCFPFKPKYSLIIAASLSVKDESARSISFLRESFNKAPSGVGLSLLKRTSYISPSSPSVNGASIETCLPELLMASLISSGAISIALEISSTEGSLSNFCSSSDKALFILLIAPILFNGNLTIRACSAKACNMDCRIHHTA